MSSTQDNTLAQTTEEERLHALAELYEEMAVWARTRYDPGVAQRKIDAVDSKSKLFIVGEAYARNQVRITGVSWFNDQGKLGPSGKNLDKILRCVGYTLYPQRTIQLTRGSVPSRSHKLTTVYTTDIVPCYPPGGGAPSPAMISEALHEQFLVREFELLKPKALLLLGQHSYSTFTSSLLGLTPKTISALFTHLSPTTQLPQYQGALIIPFLHPSPASPRFSLWLKRSQTNLCQQAQVQAIATALAR